MKSTCIYLKQFFVLTMFTIAFNVVTYAHFSPTGPTGGVISCVAKNGGTVVYWGTANGGVFHSNSSGLVSWVSIPVGLKSGKITALAHTGSYLFAGTADSGMYVFNGISGNDQYWQKINNGLSNLHITSLIAVDSITLLAGTSGGGVFKTTNKGANWVAANTSLTSMNIWSFTKSANRIFSTSDAGIFATADTGSTWFSFNDMSTNGMITNVSSYNDSTDELLVETDMGMFITGSANTTLSPSYTAAQPGLPPSALVRSIANDGLNWYLATDYGVYNSSSMVLNWTARNNGLTSLNATAIIPFTSNLLVGTGIGVFQTSSSSPNWVANNTGLNNLQTYSVATMGQNLIVTSNEKGVYVSNNAGTSYTKRNTGLTDSLHVTDLVFLGAKLFAATANAGVFVSTDTGAIWTAFTSGLNNLQMKKVVASATQVYTFNSAGEVYVSDGSAAWSAIQTGLPTGVQPSSVAFYGANVLLGTLGNGTYTKPTTGGSWAALNTGLTNMNVNAVTSIDGKLYAATQGNGVFVSVANTVSWTATSALSSSFASTLGLTGNTVDALASLSGYVFASVKGAIYATADSGATWMEAGSVFGLPTYSKFNKLTFLGNSILTTTEYNSLYVNSLSELPLNSNIQNLVNVLCHDSCNGSATIAVVGGTAPYTYSWSSGATDSIVTGLCQGTYTITVTDANSVSTIKTVTITQPSAIVVTPSSTTSTTGLDGSASVSVSGGVSPYTYAWSNSGTNASITGVGAENYVVVITDNNGCGVTEIVPVSGVVGIHEIITSDNTILVYPNPSNGNFVVDLKNSTSKVQSITVYNALGKLMQNIAIANQNQSIAISANYAAGVYYVKVLTEKGAAIHKLIIQ